MNSKTLHIFKPGRHTALSGASLAFSETDLQASAAAYDPAKHEAPIVVGHPKLDDPAYGWVKSLGFSEGGLEAETHQVDPAFAEIVSDGRFKKISASFYAPDAPGNPVPGVYYLRHVGFLGAQPPAVKGLRAPEFAGSEEGVVEFSEWDDLNNASLWRSLREWVIGKFGLDEADKAVPGWTVQSVEQGAQDEARKGQQDACTSPAFSDPLNKETSTVTPEQAAALEAENTQLKKDAAESKAREKAARHVAIHDGHASFAEGLVKAGKLLPAELAVAVATLDHFAQQETIVEFSEGDVVKPLGDSFKALLEALPKRVEFGELAGGKGAEEKIVSFAAPAGHGVDAERLDLHQRALEHQAAHPGIDYVTAVKAVS